MRVKYNIKDFCWFKLNVFKKYINIGFLLVYVRDVLLCIVCCVFWVLCNRRFNVVKGLRDVKLIIGLFEVENI